MSSSLIRNNLFNFWFLLCVFAFLFLVFNLNPLCPFVSIRGLSHLIISTYSFCLAEKREKLGGLVDKLGVIVDKHGGVWEKFEGISDKLAGTLFNKFRVSKNTKRTQFHTSS